MNSFFHAKQLKKGICLLLTIGTAFAANAQQGLSTRESSLKGQAGSVSRAPSGQQLPEQDAERLHSRMHLGLLYPLSTNGRQAPMYSNDFSFHLLMGLSKAENAFVLSGVSTVIREQAAGLQFAGVSNYVGKQTKGMQFAGVYNHTGDQLQGIQFGGVMNYAGDADGLQFAGVMNKARDVNGSQFAGVVNVAKKVKGLQFAGIINIADSSDYPVAILNFIKNGEKSIGISTDETFNLLASFRSGGRVLYGILEIGYNLKSEGDLYALGAGLGAHFAFSDRFRLNTELKSLVLDDFHEGEYSKYSLHILPALKVSERIEVFAGPSLNFVDSDMQEGKDLFKDPLWENGYGDGHLRQWYVGASAGIQFIL
ncbi:hypothetical protein EDD80_101242 [Anseongella ginsenosidimutans]|uniref:Uncharacterized protein n=1 Tax=Anseongella ginsenosidimutans TaxID=496056 RepID=A0A4R3KXQ6_9SPHI|nr:hypothetical protein [Anseongella ginsenosidimutans]QEC51269.1 hypothetical protein FRZ59_02150 [Anseongella ginsenosidimutans]TCS90044.1 hypothetical protein EDD80_101242 [Anseongella ginsenosidimutans]